MEIYLLAKSTQMSASDVAERRVDNWLSESLALIIDLENYFKSIYSFDYRIILMIDIMFDQNSVSSRMSLN